MTEYGALLKPAPVVCAVDGCGLDGCPAVGPPTSNGHPKGCGNSCPKCRGRRNRKKGLSKQREARKRLGVAPQKFGDSNEERWEDNVFANEVKAGLQVGAAGRWFLKAEAQAFANRADHGDRRLPARVTVMPDGWGREGIVMVRLSTWEQIVRPACTEFYGSDT